jgi:hypothetical protein
MASSRSRALLWALAFSAATGACGGSKDNTGAGGGSTGSALSSASASASSSGAASSSSGGSPTGKRVKWNPGHYGASGGIARPGDALSKFTPEMDQMCKDDWIVGYRLLITWSALDAGPFTFTSSVGGSTSGTLTAAPGDATYWVAFSTGEYRSVTVTGTGASWSGALSAGSVTTAQLYTTALLDAVLDRLKTHYARPKQLVITLLPMSFSGGTRTPKDFSVVPRYLTTDAAYGPSPDGSSQGWWGPPPGQTQGLYTAATYRLAVAARYAALGAALGAKYDADPSFEAILDQEDSAVVQAAYDYPPKDGTYSEVAHVTAMKSYLTTWLTAFPHTSVVSENTFIYDATGTQEFEAWMIANRIAPGSADSSGQSYYDANHAANSWGQAAYFGVTASGSTWSGPDSRGVARAMMDVEGPDIASSTHSPPQPLATTPLDIVNGLNKTVKASHAFWCNVPQDPTIKWAAVTSVLQANPLTNTDYPGNYPQ